MVYYHISIITNAINVFTIVISWGKCKYKWPPVEVCNSLDILQDMMNKTFQGFEYIRAYLNELLVYMIGDCTDHLTNMEQVFIILQENGL